MEELLENIWIYVGRGYSYQHEYIGPLDSNDVSFIWTTYYKGERIETGTSNDHRNWDQILATWVTHSRDHRLKSILGEVESKGINIIYKGY